MKKNIVLVTGMSGAGKSSAMNALEDMGYYCIDNYPKELLEELDSFVMHNSMYRNIAFSVSALDFASFLEFLNKQDVNLKVLFLDAKDDELLLRYRFTRRLHPMMSFHYADTLKIAIEKERKLFADLPADSNNIFRIDTTKMSTSSLAGRVRNRFMADASASLALTFQSFGFKHGVPMDADAVIDVRFLPNPFYEKDLRSLTGNDEAVYHYVMDDPQTIEFISRLKSYLDFMFTEYNKQNRSQMIIAIGCTGGQHRSVSICNWLYDTYKTQYRCFKSHRDIGVDEQ